MAARVTWGLKLALIAGGLFALAIISAAAASAAQPDSADEIFFYREDGLYRFYDVAPNATLPSPILAGDGYTEGWDSIAAIDLDGRGQHELFFYRRDGLFRFYNIRSNGSLPTPILAGSTYTHDWDVITAIDLDGNGQDEMFFYRKDGLFRYYNVRSDGTLPVPIASGSDYEPDWDVVTAVDIDGDAEDELFFYRGDGRFAYYDVSAAGTLGSPILEGLDYTPGWSVITAVELDNDLQDELFFYREDGLYAYYDVGATGSLGTPIREGTGYTAGWSAIVAVNLEGDLPSERISRFTTFYQCCQDRVINIRQMARDLNGLVVLPGETFSIDAALGQRTTAGGYVPAPYMVDGEGLCCVIGGGVSQIGTTIHNAVFWAGLKVVKHKPHSAWISRYPLGIEATLSYLSSDYRFTNDTVTPITIRTSSTSTSVTVEMWGNQGGWRMTGYHPTGNRSSVITMLDKGDSTAKRTSATVTGDAPGQVKIVRTLIQGGVTKTQTWFWTYIE